MNAKGTGINCCINRAAARAGDTRKAGGKHLSDALPALAMALVLVVGFRV